MVEDEVEEEKGWMGKKGGWRKKMDEEDEEEDG